MSPRSLWVSPSLFLVVTDMPDSISKIYIIGSVKYLVFSINRTSLHSSWNPNNICMFVFCCRTYILRGSFLRLLSLMWPASASWSLRSQRITEHLSSGLKVTVWLYFPTCTHMHACLPSHVVFVWIWLNYDSYLLFACPFSWKKWMGHCTGRLHQAKAPAKHH